MEPLDIKISSNDFEDEITLREYFKKLLTTLWEEEEDFSGKWPFGNSGWKYDVYKALIKNELVPGKLNKDGYVENIDTKKADDLIINLIKSL